MTTAMEDDQPVSEDSSSAVSTGLDLLLSRRQRLSDALADSPYDLILYLQRASVYAHLGYPSLAAGDAYRALLLTDEVRNESFEYHEQALEALKPYHTDPLPDVLRYGSLIHGSAEIVDGHGPAGPEPPQELAAIASLRCYQILSLSLLLCGCLKSAYSFCERGLAASPSNAELLNTQGYIQTVARRRLHKDNADDIDINELSDWGMVRREVYPWNTHEPDRFSEGSLAFLNAELASIAPKCAVQVSKLPILLDGASETDNYEIIPTCDQLGVFAKEDIAPGEIVLEEYSLLTANNRHKESICDACGTALPPLQANSEAVSCPECYDTVFCNEFCFNKAQELYHPAVCEKDVDSIAKDPEAKEADASLYLLLLARLLAMSNHQGIHPLEVKEVKYIWGDFVPPRSNDIDLSPNAGPPPDWTLPFSFKYNVEAPLHILEKMDVDIYATLPEHDIWVFSTLYAKFRGTASARKSTRDGRPDVAAVHPFWCLANHDCNPNVTWEWGGRMKLWARETRVVGGGRGGIKAGEEILNHYCDVDLPVQQRREWAMGSLGGWCMCKRCRDESAADAATNGAGNT
ncbi:Wd tetratricopeptide repeat domain-containing protein [Pleurostoma richardsiae]|uniref:Wd tetratricopeptide repeat domain-containing protein n=1 Tax=Pleurostoma richardsiae TaxID=41990 RepID=A0AA38VV40_9PEZI|nr:Wd tetratricopeptide repeat domain-containing protein [Pleurostoma richardsiae]